MLRNISVLIIGGITITLGNYLNNIPVTLQQPDGTKLMCLTTGDEFYVRIHDENNYTVIQSQKDGYYYYAQFINNEVRPTNFRADQPIPFGINLERGVKISKADYFQYRHDFISRGRGRDAPTTGIINNINIFIRFAEESEFGTSRSVMDVPFNKPDGPSMSHFYDEVSYSQLEVNTYHFPLCDMSTNLSYQDQYPRSYYQPYND